MSDEIPPCIRQLIGRCEINETQFDNDDMSLALKFGEMLHRRLTRFTEHYERRSGMYMPEDIRAKCDAQAAKDMRDILSDTHRDLMK